MAVKKDARSRGCELLADLGDHTIAVLQANTELPDDQVKSAARKIVDEMRASWGGQLIYFPKGKDLDIDERDRRMWDDFNGSNHAHLAKKYDLTLQGVYQRLRSIRQVIREEDQPDLFGN